MVTVKVLREHAVGNRVMPVGGEYEISEPLAAQRQHAGFVEILGAGEAKAAAGPAENKAEAPPKARKGKAKK